MALYQVLYWKDIPAQVKAYEGRRPVSKVLPEYFQHEIDRVAMRQGLAGTDDYLDQWLWSEKRERPGSAAEVLEQVLQELEEEFANRDKEA